MRLAVTLVYWIALGIACASYTFLLFSYGHTELVSHDQVLLVAGVAMFCSLVVGILIWVGTPVEKKETGKKHGRRRTAK